MNITDEMVEAFGAASQASVTAQLDARAEYEPATAWRAGLEAVAPLIAAQALRERVSEALAGHETALFVGGPLHGTTRTVPGESPYVVMETKGPPPWDPTEWREPERHTYSRRKVWRKVDGDRFARVVWLWGPIPAESPWAMEQTQDAVLRQWFITGVKIDS
jgi:hypothetical protein